MPALAHEIALTRALSRWRPDCMPRVIAADASRNWMLMHDGGVSLRSIIQDDRDCRHWQKIFPLYADAQIELAARVNEMLAFGILDRRLQTLPAQYAQLLDDADALRIDLPNGLTANEYARLRALTPIFAARCAELAQYKIPETLHHDDFHDANILVRDGRYAFFDWGESCAAHPFFTLVVALRSIAHTLELDARSPELARLRDTYLGAWTHYASRADLRAAFEIAQRIGLVCRALTWHQVTATLEGKSKEENAEGAPRWLKNFLAAEDEQGLCKVR